MLQIHQYQIRHKEGIASMMQEISKEFNLPISPPISSALLNALDKYWVAEIDGLVVGTIGVIKLKNNNAELKKMFVKKQYRGSENGVSNLLLQTAFKWLNEQGINKLFLGTQTGFKAAHKFYVKNHFYQISRHQLPIDYPHHPTDDSFYKLDLSSLKLRNNYNIHFREASLEDVNRLSELRVQFLLELSNNQSKKDVKKLRSQLDQYFHEKIQNGSIVVWLAEDDKKIIATSTMVIWEPPFGFSGLDKKGRGYILNMYTMRAYRKRGIGMTLLRKLMEYAKAFNIEKVHLHATDNGIQLYKKCGFIPPKYPELELKLN